MQKLHLFPFLFLFFFSKFLLGFWCSHLPKLPFPPRSLSGYHPSSIHLLAEGSIESPIESTVIRSSEYPVVLYTNTSGTYKTKRLRCTLNYHWVLFILVSGFTLATLEWLQLVLGLVQIQICCIGSLISIPWPSFW